MAPKNEAATKLQAIQRGKKTRTESEQNKLKGQDHEEQDAAATKLQAMQRGKKTRMETETQEKAEKEKTQLNAKEEGARQEQEKEKAEQEQEKAEQEKAKEEQEKAKEEKAEQEQVTCFATHPHILLILFILYVRNSRVHSVCV